MTDEELGRYARQIVLREIGGAGQRRLARATVVLVGAGGIGAPAIQYLAGAGVGRLVLIDDDHVDLSNLQRQILFATDAIGMAKVTASASRIAALNPHVAVVTHQIRIDAANAPALLAGAGVVIDGSDSFATRLVVADAARAAQVPLVSAAVGQFEGQLGVFRGWEADQPCYRCFVGGSPEREGATCADEGVLGPVTGVLGSMAALEAIRCIVPFGDPMAGRLVIADLLSMRFRTLTIPKDPGCPGCGG